MHTITLLEPGNAGGDFKHNGNCISVTPKCANCKGDHISNDRNCTVYRKEYEIKRLMAYENIAMRDARKLVFSKFKRNFRYGTEEFPPLQSKIITPFNEVVNSQDSQHLLNKQRIKPNNKALKTNQFYNYQKDKCEDFIGNRESTQSENGIALNKEKSSI